eukprot:13395978-Heterocapsa_arctica.AAC.1
MNGAALTPDDRAARSDIHGCAVVATRRGKAARRAAALKGAAVNVYLPPATAPKGKGKDDKGDKAGAKGKNGKGKRRRDDWGQELCFSFNNK